MDEHEAIEIAREFAQQHGFNTAAAIAATYNHGKWTVAFSLQLAAGVVQHPNEVFVSVDELTEETALWEPPF